MVPIHTRVLHKIVHVDSVFNRVVCLSDHFSRKNCESKLNLLHDSFTLFNYEVISTSVFTPVGSNRYCAHKYEKLYSTTLRKTLSVQTLQDSYIIYYQ